MRTVFFIMLIALVVGGLHIFALHKRVEYYQTQCDREYARGMTDTVFAFQNGMVKVFSNVVNQVGGGQ